MFPSSQPSSCCHFFCRQLFRASQYDPDFDADSYNYQLQQQSRQLSPRASQELSRPIGSYQDHYSTSSFSGNSAATTIINLTSQNNSSHGLEQVASDPSSTLPTDHRPTSSLSAPPITNPDQMQPTSSPPTSNKLSTPLPTSILKKTPQSQHSSSLGQPPSSQLPDRTSRSSLQPSPFSASLAAAAAGGEGGKTGPLNGIYTQPNPTFLHSEKDPQQQLSHRHSMVARDTARNSVLTLAQNRQDEGRMQLDKDRAYMKNHKLMTWTKSKFLLLVANTLVSSGGAWSPHLSLVCTL